MSNEDAEELMENFEKWDSHQRKRDFIQRMEHKLYRKERQGRGRQ